MHNYLDEHQIKAVEALFELKRICDKHNIRFYLLAGTTLGAVRHEGMIPWDDDVDVGLLVEDLFKLQAVIQDELNPELGFEYASLEVEPGFPRLFGKILYNRQSCIDLFVLAKWTNNDFRGNLHWNITRFCVESYYHSIGYTKPKVVSKNTAPAQIAPAPACEIEGVACEAEAVACETEAVACEAEAVACETEAVACEAEAVACETEAVACETEAVACETETAADEVMTVACENESVSGEAASDIHQFEIVSEEPDEDEELLEPDTSAPDFEADEDIYSAVDKDPELEAEEETEEHIDEEAIEKEVEAHLSDGIAEDSVCAAQADAAAESADAIPAVNSGANPAKHKRKAPLKTRIIRKFRRMRKKLHKSKKKFKGKLRRALNVQPTKYAKNLSSQRKLTRSYKKKALVYKKKSLAYQKKLLAAEKKLRKLQKLDRKQKIKAILKPKNVRKIIRFLIYKCCFFLKTEDYIRLARWNEDFFGRHGYDCYANIYSIYGMKKERIQKEWIENISYVTFEGEQFITVGDTDAYLTHLYGNYMQLPPEEKRIKARHAEVYARPANHAEPNQDESQA